jgi:antibiotic biosynthesis monooxygenase (ABM) superfamily enzyme
MKKKHKALPPPYSALTRDTRFAGTYEVLVPAPDRVKPHRVPLQFESRDKAETWIHSPEGRETIAKLLSDSPR